MVKSKSLLKTCSSDNIKGKIKSQRDIIDMIPHTRSSSFTTPINTMKHGPSSLKTERNQAKSRKMDESSKQCAKFMVNWCDEVVQSYTPAYSLPSDELDYILTSTQTEKPFGTPRNMYSMDIQMRSEINCSPLAKKRKITCEDEDTNYAPYYHSETTNSCYDYLNLEDEKVVEIDNDNDITMNCIP